MFVGGLSLFFANLPLTLYYKKNESISLPQNCQKYKTAISAFKTKFLKIFNFAIDSIFDFNHWYKDKNQT